MFTQICSKAHKNSKKLCPHVENIRCAVSCSALSNHLFQKIAIDYCQQLLFHTTLLMRGTCATFVPLRKQWSCIVVVMKGHALRSLKPHSYSSAVILDIRNPSLKMYSGSSCCKCSYSPIHGHKYERPN